MNSNLVKSLVVRSKLPAIWVGLALFTAAGTANATAISANSNAFGLDVGLNLVSGLVVANIATTPLANSAPSPYNNNQSIASVNASGTGLATLFPVTATTGVINDHVQSDVDGTNGTKFALGDTSVNQLSLNLGLESALVNPLLTVGSNSTITSDARIDGNYGALNGTMDSVLQGLAISVLGTNVPLLLDVNGRAAPNTTLLNVNGVAGLNIILNEQLPAGDGTNTQTAETNAIHIKFNAVDLGILGVSGLNGLLNGDIIIAHSAATMNATAPQNGIVPVPPTLLLLALAALGLARARMRQTHPKASSPGHNRRSWKRAGNQKGDSISPPIFYRADISSPMPLGGCIPSRQLLKNLDPSCLFLRPSSMLRQHPSFA